MSRRRPGRGLKLAILIAVGVVLSLCAVVGLVVTLLAGALRDEGDSKAAATATAPAEAKGRTILYVAYSPEKEPLFLKLAREFNRASKQYYVLATKLETEDMLDGALAGRFTAISPDSAIWLGQLDKLWQASNPDAPALVGTSVRYALSPVVVAMWESVARSLGYPDRPLNWAALLERAGRDANFRWSHGATTTASGLLAITAEFYAGAGKYTNLTRQDLERPQTRDYVARLERTVQQYGGESEDKVIARLLEGGARNLDAFVGQEQLVVTYNARARGEKLVAVYPQEGTFWMDHPLVLLEGSWVSAEQRRGFRELASFLARPETQRLVLQEGYRPADLRVSLDDAESRIRQANGVDPAQPYTMLTLPPYGVLEAIQNAWAILKRPANIYLVADVSGSMEGEKLAKAKEALHSFLSQIKSDRERVGLIVFSSRVLEVVPLGELGKNRARLETEIDQLRAGGNTALFDAIYQAFDRLQAQNDPERINAVLVMSDGQENASRAELTAGTSRGSPSRLVTVLQERARARGVAAMVFAVAYGGEADLKVLTQIAESTHGQAYPSDPETIRKLYRKLSAFF